MSAVFVDSTLSDLHRQRLQEERTVTFVGWLSNEEASRSNSCSSQRLERSSASSNSSRCAPAHDRSRTSPLLPCLHVRESFRTWLWHPCQTYIFSTKFRGFEHLHQSLERGELPVASVSDVWAVSSSFAVCCLPLKMKSLTGSDVGSLPVDLSRFKSSSKPRGKVFQPSISAIPTLVFSKECAGSELRWAQNL